MTSSDEHVATTTSVPAGSDGAARRRVDAALVSLQAVADQPLVEHAVAYERLHEELQAVLAEIDGG